MNKFAINIRFLLLCFALNAFGQSSQKNTDLTAKEIMSRIKDQITVPWQNETVDTFKAGDPDTRITGIATTFMATMEVLKKAKALGLNLIITHEPTFYTHFDATDTYGVDPIVAAKQKFIEENGLVVFRYHDHIHLNATDGIYKGVVDKLGWSRYNISERPYLYNLPESTLRHLSNQLKQIFNAPGIRVVGDPDMNMGKIGLVLGAAGPDSQIKALQNDDVEVLIIGEAHEWETVEYVRDAANLGKRKALIILGHAHSEEAGMGHCAAWLKTFVPEVPITFVPAGDPFWVPE